MALTSLILAATVTYADAQQFVVWQHNISWYASAAAAETAIEHAMTDYPLAPDVLTFQECGAPCICGDNGDYNATTGRCDAVGGPSIERALRSLDHGNEYTFRRNGLRVIGFRDARFRQIGSDMHWGASVDGAADYFAECSTVEVGNQLSVMLEDTRTAMQVLVSTGHWFVGRDCACRQVRQLEVNWQTAPELRDGTDNAKSYVDLHLFTGDWNAQPLTSLPLAYEEGASCDGFELGGETHEDTAGNAFTFCQGAGGVSSPDTCTNKQKVDYLWAKNYNQSGITWKGSPDTTANYFNDHRALRTVFTYKETGTGGGSPEGGTDPVSDTGGTGGVPATSDDASVPDASCRVGRSRDGLGVLTLGVWLALLRRRRTA